MNKTIKWFGIIALIALIMFSMVSCSKSSGGGTREVDGVKYTIISPQDYAKKIKSGEIGIDEMYVIDGLVLGATDNNLMIQKAGLTNLFSSDKPIDLNMGAKIRVYIKTKMINTVLLSASEATIIKWEKL